MLATVHSAVVDGIDGVPVRVEVDVRDGLPSYAVVGMPDAACRESRDRVRAAIANSRLRWPATADHRQSGAEPHQEARAPGSIWRSPPGILVADKQLPAQSIADLGMAGELGLDGSVRPVPGMIIIAAASRGSQFLAPVGNRAEVSLVQTGRGPSARKSGRTRSRVCRRMVRLRLWPSSARATRLSDSLLEFADVRGQPMARFAAEVAAAGGHHLVLIGPPGAGKTMLASRLCSLLPGSLRC